MSSSLRTVATLALALAATVASQRLGRPSVSCFARAFGRLTMGGLVPLSTALVGGRGGLGRRCHVGLALARFASLDGFAAAAAFLVLATHSPAFRQRRIAGGRCGARQCGFGSHRTSQPVV